jgi:hypothetical protein
MKSLPGGRVSTTVRIRVPGTGRYQASAFGPSLEAMRKQRRMPAPDNPPDETKIGRCSDEVHEDDTDA